MVSRTSATTVVEANIRQPIGMNDGLVASDALYVGKPSWHRLMAAHRKKTNLPRHLKAAEALRHCHRWLEVGQAPGLRLCRARPFTLLYVLQKTNLIDSKNISLLRNVGNGAQRYLEVGERFLAAKNRLIKKGGHIKARSPPRRGVPTNFLHNAL